VPDDFVLRHSQPAPLLYGDRISLDFGRPVHVMEAVIPEISAFRKLAQMCQFVSQVEVQVQSIALAIVAFEKNNRRYLNVYVYISVVSRPDLHPCPIQKRAERSCPGSDAANYGTLFDPWQKGSVGMHS
jgi:hypothetical protein